MHNGMHHGLSKVVSVQDSAALIADALQFADMYAWFLEHSPMLAQYPQSLWPSWQFRFGFVGVGFVGVVGFEDEEHEPQEASQFADMYAWFLEHSPMLAQYPPH